MGIIENSIFSNFSVSYAGAFFIDKSVDLYLSNVHFAYLTTTSYKVCSINDKVSGSCFIFLGKNIYCNKICGYALSAAYSSHIYAYTESQYDSQLNYSSFNEGSCAYYSVIIGTGKCLTKENNFTKLIAPVRVATLNVGWNSVSYYHRDIIAVNNTGENTLGSTTSSNIEQKHENIALISNTYKF